MLRVGARLWRETLFHDIPSKDGVKSGSSPAHIRGQREDPTPTHADPLPSPSKGLSSCTQSLAMRLL